MNNSATITMQTVLERSQRLVSADLDGETVLMSMDYGTYYGMDPIGSHIWSLLASPLSVSEICTVLLENYDVDPERCQGEVISFLYQLLEGGLLRVVC